MARSITPDDIELKTVTIADGQTKSGAVELNGRGIYGLGIPAGFAGTAITFEVEVDGTFLPVKTPAAGADLSIVVAASTYVAMTLENFPGVGNVKLVTNSAATGAEEVHIYSRAL